MQIYMYRSVSLKGVVTIMSMQVLASEIGSKQACVFPTPNTHFIFYHRGTFPLLLPMLNPVFNREYD